MAADCTVGFFSPTLKRLTINQVGSTRPANPIGLVNVWSVSPPVLIAFFSPLSRNKIRIRVVIIFQIYEDSEVIVQIRHTLHKKNKIFFSVKECMCVTMSFRLLRPV